MTCFSPTLLNYCCTNQYFYVNIESVDYVKGVTHRDKPTKNYHLIQSMSPLSSTEFFLVELLVSVYSPWLSLTTLSNLVSIPKMQLFLTTKS